MEQSHSVIKDILNASTNHLHEKKKKNQIMKKVHKIAEEGPNRNGERLDGKKR